MVDAAKDWDKEHPASSVVFAQGKSGTDDEGEINAIQATITQGVKAIAITPTSPNVQGALQKAVDAGIKVVLIDNDIPDWNGKTARRRHRQPRRRQARRHVPGQDAASRAPRSPCCRACSATRRSTTA